MTGSRAARWEVLVLVVQVALVAVVQVAQGFEFHRAETEARQCMEDHRPTWKVYRMTNLGCLRQGLVLWPIDYKCYTLHGRGHPCMENQRLVYSDSPCPEAKCLGYASSSGLPCTGGQVSHHGDCVDPEDREQCGGELGRRLVPDMHGSYSCRCSRELGYSEWEGKCYVQYSQGPCKEGEQLEPGVGNPVCKMNPCDVGYFSAGDGFCYFVDTWVDFPGSEKLSQQEKTDRTELIKALLGEQAATFCTFCNEHCAKKTLEGECINTTLLPEVSPAGEEELLQTLALAFGLNSEEKLFVMGNTDFPFP
eukprot:GFUD01058784.1.p1 GENE.GFUD01058784.1~~GFUD01058784.1.p1  ORF type:complete len:307 (+),score=72.32 GFUD01058784.1:3-923(+)